jgi:hypothetical protein
MFFLPVENGLLIGHQQDVEGGQMGRNRSVRDKAGHHDICQPGLLDSFFQTLCLTILPADDYKKDIRKNPTELENNIQPASFEQTPRISRDEGILRQRKAWPGFGPGEGNVELFDIDAVMGNDGRAPKGAVSHLSDQKAPELFRNEDSGFQTF